MLRGSNRLASCRMRDSVEEMPPCYSQHTVTDNQRLTHSNLPTCSCQARHSGYLQFRVEEIEILRMNQSPNRNHMTQRFQSH
jgi:hypothetical protein